jgi:hypothetical protein
VEPARAVPPVHAEVVREERRRDHALRLVHPARAPQPAHPDVHGGEAGLAGAPARERRRSRTSSSPNDGLESSNAGDDSRAFSVHLGPCILSRSYTQ